jgi:ABC-type lipoprotein release transport system permease subunit
MAAYSSTPLAKKLGIKNGFRIRLINEPDYYFNLFTDLPTDIKILTEKKSKKNFIHLFVKSLNDFEKHIHELKNEIEPDGIIWVSWYKKSAKIPTDVTEDKIRATALSIGLVDIKVCAVDEVWSGLKLVIPVKERIKSQ